MCRETTQRSHIGIALSNFQQSDGLTVQAEHIGELLNTQVVIDPVTDHSVSHLPGERGLLPLLTERGIISLVPIDKRKYCWR